MASGQESDNLLESLKQLFFRVVTLRAESRARSTSNNNSINSQNIVSSLSDCVDKLAADASNKPANTARPHTPDSGNIKHGRAPFSTNPSPRDKPGELSLHLKESHKYSGVSQDTGNKLMHSTWEHFHAAIRLARQGDIDAARMHIELTNSALKEAANYLPESEYSKFSKEVIKALKQI